MRPRFTSNSNSWPQPRQFGNFHRGLAAACIFLVAATQSRAEIPAGSLDLAKAYFAKLSTTLNYSTPEKIGETTLNDVVAYLGFQTLNAADLEFDSPEKLMANGAARGDVLASRFFEPKMMNVKFKEGDALFRLGYRKLIRLKAQPGSTAEANHIFFAVVLFNMFTLPDKDPFDPSNLSVNTQVILLPDPSHARPLLGKPGDGKLDTLYWLDYQNATTSATGPGKPGYVPGKLGYMLHSSFEAAELPGEGNKDYFVPHACIACHGNNPQRAFLNFMDTDHWYDRLETDFPAFKKANRLVLYDAGTNDRSSPKYQDAFNVIRMFNEEADHQAERTQPKHDETLGSAKWVEVHKGNSEPLPLIKRVFGPAPQWSDTPNEVEVLETLNQYCYRCHGTVKFSVFNKQTTWERKANIEQRIAPNAAKGLKMPPDRDLPEDKRQLLLKFLNS